MITIPTLSELIASFKSAIEANYGITIPSTGKNFVRALTAAEAGKTKLMYLAIGNVQKNVWVDTADPESLGGTLERFGRIKLARNPFPPQSGGYAVTVTGDIGATIKAQTTFKGNDEITNSGFLYILDADYVLTATTDTITLRALTSGVDSRLFVGDGLTSTAPIAFVNKNAVVASVITEALSAESTEDYRKKIDDSFKMEAQGGSSTDFRLWSFDVQGVAKVYPYAKSGFSACMLLYVEANAIDSIDGKGTPSQTMIDAVEEVIEFDPDTTLTLNDRGRRPIGVQTINFLPITVKQVDIIINDFQNLTVDVQAAIETALTNMVNAIRPFVAAADILSEKNDILDTNKIIAGILNQQPGSVFGTIELYVEGALVPTYTFTYGDIPNLNSVTYA